MKKLLKWGLILFLGIPFAIGFLGSMFSSPKNPTDKGKNSVKTTPTIARRSDFKANVKFTGTQFVISNLDDLDCQDAKLELNDNKYTLEGYTLETGKTYEVGAAQFTKKDGTRFNPFQTKPMDFFIFCRGENALWGAGWLGNW